ncbi:MAG: hypothetical protein ABI613_08160 [Gemmatimonadota bacterium]
MRSLVPLLASIVLLAFACQNDNASTENATIQMDSSVTFQTWLGWGGRSATDVPNPAKTQILDAAVNDLGLTLTGVPARFKAGKENPGMIGWDSVETMKLASQWAAPLKQRVSSDFIFTVRAIGEPADRNEIVRVLNALKTLGLVPDVWIVENEPDIGTRLPVGELADSMAMTCSVFRQQGIPTVVSGPTMSTVAGTLSYAQVLRNDSRLTGCLGEWTFHQYGTTTRAQLQALAALGEETGLPIKMDEHHGAPVSELMDDIEFANLAAWQRDGFAGNGCQSCYSLYSTPNGVQWFLAGNTGFYRQFTRAIRPGMVRWKATSSNGAVRAVAFGGGSKAAVVVQSSGGGAITMGGLPAGTYEVSYTLGNGRWTGAGTASPQSVTRPSVTITGGQDLQTSLPAAGVLTVRRL